MNCRDVLHPWGGSAGGAVGKTDLKKRMLKACAKEQAPKIITSRAGPSQCSTPHNRERYREIEVEVDRERGEERDRERERETKRKRERERDREKERKK